jgi:hypothetical protein
LVNEGLRVTCPVKGYSMLPFIIGSKESVDLVKPENLQEGHVVLAWVEGCRYVVHRIIKIEGEQVTLMGDGNVAGTEHCYVSDIKAFASHVVDADGQAHDLYNLWRSVGAKMWYRLRPVRRYLLWLYRKCSLTGQSVALL